MTAANIQVMLAAAIVEANTGTGDMIAFALALADLPAKDARQPLADFKAKASSAYGSAVQRIYDGKADGDKDAKNVLMFAYASQTKEAKKAAADKAAATKAGAAPGKAKPLNAMQVVAAFMKLEKGEQKAALQMMNDFAKS